MRDAGMSWLEDARSPRQWMPHSSREMQEFSRPEGGPVLSCPTLQGTVRRRLMVKEGVAQPLEVPT